MLDANWWRRTGWILEDLARADDERIVDAIFRFNLALVANTQLTDESWKKSRDTSLDLFNDIMGLVRPWDAKSREQRQKDSHSAFRNQYKRLIGDLDNPDFDKFIAEESARILSMADEVEEESDDQRIDRLLRERSKAGSP